MDTYESMMDDILKNIGGTPDPRAQALRNLRACLNKALKDDTLRMPSYLHAAINNALAQIK